AHQDLHDYVLARPRGPHPAAARRPARRVLGARLGHAAERRVQPDHVPRPGQDGLGDAGGALRPLAGAPGGHRPGHRALPEAAGRADQGGRGGRRADGARPRSREERVHHLRRHRASGRALSGGLPRPPILGRQRAARPGEGAPGPTLGGAGWPDAGGRVDGRRDMRRGARGLVGLLLGAVLACSPSAAGPQGGASRPGAPPQEPAAGAAGAAPATAAAGAAPGTAGARAATPPAPVKISAAYASKGANQLPLWLAVERGYFAQEGLDAELVFLSSTLSTQGLIANSVQFMLAGNEGVELNLEAGSP